MKKAKLCRDGDIDGNGDDSTTMRMIRMTVLVILMMKQIQLHKRLNHLRYVWKRINEIHFVLLQGCRSEQD